VLTHRTRRVAAEGALNRVGEIRCNGHRRFAHDAGTLCDAHLDARRSRVSLDSIAAFVEGDAAITARVLQTVNSAYFSRKRGIDTVREAITLMGVEIVRVLVLTTEMFAMFDRGQTSAHSRWWISRRTA